MSDAATNGPNPTGSPAKVTTGKRGLSLIWFVPLVAAAIGGWLVYRAVTEKGPAIRITFSTAAGIEAEKTHVKYKGIVVGEVEAVDIKKDLSGAVVTARLNKGTGFTLTDKTRFWVVKPRISAGQISGLGTLLSGAYIGIDPVTGGTRTREFRGLERPPAVFADEAGRRFKLRSRSLSSLDAGSPVYYHQVNVGRVTDYAMQDNGDILFDVFVKEPHHTLVVQSTRFWNAGGIDLTLDTEGIRLHTESLAAILAGGIAFDTSASLDDAQSVDEGHEFRLFRSERASKTRKYARKEHFLMYFEGSVRGLEVGAPVEFRGIQVGTVEEVRLRVDPTTLSVKIPVLIAIEPGRYTDSNAADPQQAMNALVKRGLRGQLQTGNLLTGKKFIELEFHPDEKPAELDLSGRYAAIPTMGGSVAELLTSAEGLVKQLRTTASRINTLLASDDVNNSLDDLAGTLHALRGVSEKVNTTLEPNLNAALTQAEGTLAEVKSMLSANATTRIELNRLLVELTEAAKSIRAAADYFEQHPNSIIFGKDK